MNAREIVAQLGGRWYGNKAYGLVQCPAHEDTNPSCIISDGKSRLLVHCFAGCDWRDILDALESRGIDIERDGPPELCSDTPDGQLRKAAYFWRRRKPIWGTPAYTYLREARGYGGTIWYRLAYLPPTKPDHHPALIVVFGITEFRGIHLTLLKLDGSGKADVDNPKIMVGPSSGWPLVVGPPTANGQPRLAITEGIEDALSVYEATGLEAWAAGTANRMPRLADKVPERIKTIIIFAHPDTAGKRGAIALAQALTARDFEVFVEGIVA